ncbi:MAG: spore coat protein CotJB [Clostridia bacterium]|nr:spore coat protein CotJB [Clostridia bacterium]
MTDSCQALLQKIRAIDLQIIDSGLYLNANPCPEAEAFYETLIRERAALAEQYEQNTAPLTKSAAIPVSRWTETPWPWEREAD